MAGKQRPITLEYLADVRQFLRKNAKAEESVEDVMHRLLDAGDAGQDMERKLERAMRDAAKDTEKLERAVEEVPKATDDMADRAARDFDRVGDEGLMGNERWPVRHYASISSRTG